jgi:hypothetical protein
MLFPLHIFEAQQKIAGRSPPNISGFQPFEVSGFELINGQGRGKSKEIDLNNLFYF